MALASTAVPTAVLKSVPMFGGFPEDQLRVLATMVTRRSAPRGTVIMREGDPTDALYIVMSGRLKVMMGEADGKEVILGILGAGEFFGEMGLIDDSPRSATVIAIEPCELLAVGKRAFKKCLNENIALALAVLRVVVQRLRTADRKIGSLAMLDVYGRVARILLELAVERDGKLQIPDKLTQKDIAARVGASREMISRIFSDLADGGYVRKENGQLVIARKPPPRW